MVFRFEGHLDSLADRRAEAERQGVCKILHVRTIRVASRPYPMAVPRPHLDGEAANQAPQCSAEKMQRGCGCAADRHTGCRCRVTIATTPQLRRVIIGCEPFTKATKLVVRVSYAGWSVQSREAFSRMVNDSFLRMYQRGGGWAPNPGGDVPRHHHDSTQGS